MTPEVSVLARQAKDCSHARMVINDPNTESFSPGSPSMTPKVN